MKLASIQIVGDIRPIAGADRIEATTVLGYQTVIKKGEFRPGDLCVWHEPDTVVAERPEYEFLRAHGFRNRQREVEQTRVPIGVVEFWILAGGDNLSRERN